MSRAFVKEDLDIPERIRRVRSASGLPPGALNYMTAQGAHRLREEIAKLRVAGVKNSDQVVELERILASAPIVGFPAIASDSVAFGATVTTLAADGRLATYRIVGVDEIGLEDNAVSWISPIGKALLNAELGDRVSLEGENNPTLKILKIEYVPT